jgi:hypothetical protein
MSGTHTHHVSGLTCFVQRAGYDLAGMTSY